MIAFRLLVSWHGDDTQYPFFSGDAARRRIRRHRCGSGSSESLQSRRRPTASGPVRRTPVVTKDGPDHAVTAIHSGRLHICLLHPSVSMSVSSLASHCNDKAGSIPASSLCSAGGTQQRPVPIPILLHFERWLRACSMNRPPQHTPWLRGWYNHAQMHSSSEGSRKSRS
jgi:hypothetical protein